MTDESPCRGHSGDATEDAGAPPDFENALEQLERIVADLESGQLTLSRSVEQYERGVRILRQCHDALEQVQQRIELLTGVHEDGSFESRPLRPAEGEAETGASPGRKSARGSRSEVDDDGRLF